jgi:hypothetical protein
VISKKKNKVCVLPSMNYWRNLIALLSSVSPRVKDGRRIRFWRIWIVARNRLHGNPHDWQVQLLKKPNLIDVLIFLIYFAAGSMAGVLEHCVMYPVDSVKVNINQVSMSLILFSILLSCVQEFINFVNKAS